MSHPPRVLITGVGLVTPFGEGCKVSWKGILSGERAIKQIVEPPPSFWPTGSAAAFAPGSNEVRDHPFFREDSSGNWLCSDKGICTAVAASLEAAEQAGINSESVDSTRAACVIGSSKGGMRSWHQNYGVPLDTKPEPKWTSNSEKFPEATWLRLTPNGAAATVARFFNLQGGALAPVTACATGMSSILRGADLIRHGECDVVLAGSTDASATPAVAASFRKLGVLASRNADPAEAVKPYDRNRTGFHIGEGAGVVVLESESHARARGVKPIAEWLTGGMACEASGITQLEKEPEALTWLIRDVLRRSGVSPGEIDYVSLHGTATKANDLAEIRAIKAAFGEAAYNLSASSLKGAIGHLLGAAGSVEFAATLLAMRDGQLPPTMNLTDPDDECDLDFVAGNSKPREVSHAMKLSLGFGGHLVAGVIRKV